MKLDWNKKEPWCQRLVLKYALYTCNHFDSLYLSGFYHYVLYGRKWVFAISLIVKSVV